MTSALLATTEIDVVTTVAPAPSKRRRFYRPELDALRFFAFMSVFMCHSTSIFMPRLSAAGAFGLCLFFLLSAFLITELLQREIEATGTIDIRAFYIRRSLRIWPLYYGFLLLSVLIGLFTPVHRTPGAMYLSYVFMVGNVYFGRHDMHLSPLLYLWSISVEEQFYLFWPVMNRVLNRRHLVIAALTAFPIAWVALGVLRSAYTDAEMQHEAWTSSLVHFQFFACGALLSLAMRGRIPHLSGWVRWCSLLVGVACWTVAGRWAGISVGPFSTGSLAWGYLAVAVGCTAMLLACYGMDAQWVPAPLVYLGKISFGLYVFHKIALEFAEFLLHRIPFFANPAHHHLFSVGHIASGLLMTVAMAALSYHFYELPFLTLKDRFAIVPSRAA